MPIHDVGYREWKGETTPPAMRWWMISESGIRIAIKSTWVKRIIFFCWLPILYWGVGFFVFEQFNQGPRQRIIDFSQEPDFQNPGRGEEDMIRFGDEAFVDRGRQGRAALRDLARESADRGRQVLEAESDELVRRRIADQMQEEFGAFPAIDKLVASLSSDDPEAIRHTFWSWLLMTYFRYPQSTALIFLLGFITPSLIARDIRSRALLLYFSRPIGRFEYMLGKLAIPAAFLGFITVLPALVLYLLGVFLSPEPSVILTTWDIPVRILLASAVVILPTVSLALMFSSLTQESRFAAFAWFAVWALGQGAWFAVLISAAIRRNINPVEAAELPEVQRFSPVSLYNNLGNVQSWIFGFEEFSIALPSLIVLLVVTGLSLTVLFRRISKSVHI